MRLEGLEELCEALVIYLFHDLYLPLDTLAAVWLEQLELFVYFDCDFLVQCLVQADSDDGVGTLAYSLANDVVVDVLYVAAFGAELVLFVLALLPV